MADPHGSFGNAWSYRWNPQVWAGMGYAVVMIDFHGSSGYGEAFAEVDHRPLGRPAAGRPAEGLGLRRSPNTPFLDGDHACALGGSYGGYMIDWIAGNWAKPWKCLVDHDGVFDVRLMSYSTDIPGFQQAQNDAPTWTSPEAVERFNPIDHVADWSRRSWSCTAATTIACRSTRAWAPMARPVAACAKRAALFPGREPLGAEAAELCDVVRDGAGLDEALAGKIVA